MAAYAALVSVMQIINQLDRHPFPPISIDKQEVESLTEIVTFLQEFLEGYNSPFGDSDEADPLEMRIADAAYAAEDVIESYIVDVIQLMRRSTSAHHLTWSWSSFFNCFRGYNREAATHEDVGGEATSGEEIRPWNKFCLDLQKVIEEMDLIKRRAMEMMREKSSAVQAHQTQKNIFRSSSVIGKNSTMNVGFDGVLIQLLDKLTGGPSTRQVIPITGMGGIGKTTLARNIFDNALVKEHFDICAWITISQQYNTKEILCKILSQESGKSSEEELGVELHKYLYGRRYLIIMDDMWSIEVWEKMRFFFADCDNGSRIIVTTRQSYLTSQLTDSNSGFHMKFLDEVNSWNLFSKTVFREESFPLELENIGKKIVEKCRGLPLSIVVIGGLLAKSQHTQEYWEYIEHKFNSIVNLENDEYCLKILKLSYNHLPAYLKPSFLYMGSLEEDKRIRVSTLIKLWVSEGFLKPEKGKSLEIIGEGFLKELIDRNLILVNDLEYGEKVKYCHMHDLLRDLCIKEAEKERFYHVIGQDSPQGIYKHNQRRMFYPRISSNEALKSVSHVRSFTSQHHRVEFFPDFRLLRIFNASYSDIYMLEFEGPEYRLKDVIHKLVNSRYLAIKTSSWKTKLPSSVSFLWNLHTLRIEAEKGVIVAPVEIWKMSQLRHVEFLYEMYLPDPPSDTSTVILENLQTLKGIVNFKCGEEVVKRIPNIKKLAIIYEKDKEIGRHDDDYYCLSNLECLCKLESFTFNRHSGSDDEFEQSLNFPQSLKKLILIDHYSSFGWEEMLEKIGSLPLLQKLSLRNVSFTTHKWETVEGQFPSLKFLEVSGCRGLKQWMIEDNSHFPCLEHLHLAALTQLEEIPTEIGEIPTLQSIQLEHCSESAVKSAKKIVEEQEKMQGEEQLSFHVRVFVYDKKQEGLESLASPNFKVNLDLVD